MITVDILKLIGAAQVAVAHPQGSLFVETFNGITGTTTLAATVSGTEALAAFEKLDVTNQVKVNAIFDQYRKIITGCGTTTAFANGVHRQRNYRSFMALMMAVALTIMAVTIVAIECYIGIMTKTQLESGQFTVPLMCLALVVWSYNGLLTKENREAIAAGLARAPSGFVNSFLDSIRGRNQYQTTMQQQPMPQPDDPQNPRPQ